MLCFFSAQFELKIQFAPQLLGDVNMKHKIVDTGNSITVTPNF